VSENNWNRRPNPKRRVRLEGLLNLKASRQLAKKIKVLQEKSFEPITVDINSGGGEAKAFLKLERIFSKNGPRRGTGRFVTLAGDAASAAACLLVVGHHACMRKNALVSFHGVIGQRFNNGNTLRQEQVLAIALRMDWVNRKIARKMARRIVFRMATRCTKLPESGKRKFPWVSSGIFLQNYTQHIKKCLSSKKLKILLTQSFHQCELLYSSIKSIPFAASSSRDKNFAPMEAKIFKNLISHETKIRKGKSWTINPAAASQIMMEYLRVRELIHGHQMVLIEDLVNGYGKYFLSKKQAANYCKLLAETPMTAKVYLFKATQSYALGLWCFSLAFCHGLLSGEFTISADDAYWLGLIDEVVE